MSALDAIRKYSEIYMYILDWRSAAHFKPIDATSNPCIVWENLQMEHNKVFISDAARYAKSKRGLLEDQVRLSVNRLLVNLV